MWDKLKRKGKHHATTTPSSSQQSRQHSQSTHSSRASINVGSQPPDLPDLDMTSEPHSTQTTSTSSAAQDKKTHNSPPELPDLDVHFTSDNRNDDSQQHPEENNSIPKNTESIPSPEAPAMSPLNLHKNKHKENRKNKHSSNFKYRFDSSAPPELPNIDDVELPEMSQAQSREPSYSSPDDAGKTSPQSPPSEVELSPIPSSNRNKNYTKSSQNKSPEPVPTLEAPSPVPNESNQLSPESNSSQVETVPSPEMPSISPKLSSAQSTAQDLKTKTKAKSNQRSNKFRHKFTNRAPSELPDVEIPETEEPPKPQPSSEHEDSLDLNASTPIAPSISPIPASSGSQKYSPKTEPTSSNVPQLDTPPPVPNTPPADKFSKSKEHGTESKYFESETPPSMPTVSPVPSSSFSHQNMNDKSDQSSRKVTKSTHYKNNKSPVPELPDIKDQDTISNESNKPSKNEGVRSSDFQRGNSYSVGSPPAEVEVSPVPGIQQKSKTKTNNKSTFPHSQNSFRDSPPELPEFEAPSPAQNVDRQQDITTYQNDKIEENQESPEMPKVSPVPWSSQSVSKSPSSSNRNTKDIPSIGRVEIAEEKQTDTHQPEQYTPDEFNSPPTPSLDAPEIDLPPDEKFKMKTSFDTRPETFRRKRNIAKNSESSSIPEIDVPKLDFDNLEPHNHDAKPQKKDKSSQKSNSSIIVSIALSMIKQLQANLSTNMGSMIGNIGTSHSDKGTPSKKGTVVIAEKELRENWEKFPRTSEWYIQHLKLFSKTGSHCLLPLVHALCDWIPNSDSHSQKRATTPRQRKSMYRKSVALSSNTIDSSVRARSSRSNSSRGVQSKIHNASVAGVSHYVAGGVNSEKWDFNSWLSGLVHFNQDEQLHVDLADYIVRLVVGDVLGVILQFYDGNNIPESSVDALLKHAFNTFRLAHEKQSTSVVWNLFGDKLASQWSFVLRRVSKHNFNAVITELHSHIPSAFIEKHDTSLAMQYLFGIKYVHVPATPDLTTYINFILKIASNTKDGDMIKTICLLLENAFKQVDLEVESTFRSLIPRCQEIITKAMKWATTRHSKKAALRLVCVLMSHTTITDFEHGVEGTFKRLVKRLRAGKKPLMCLECITMCLEDKYHLDRRLPIKTEMAFWSKHSIEFRDIAYHEEATGMLVSGIEEDSSSRRYHMFQVSKHRRKSASNAAVKLIHSKYIDRMSALIKMIGKEIFLGKKSLPYLSKEPSEILAFMYARLIVRMAAHRYDYVMTELLPKIFNPSVTHHDYLLVGAHALVLILKAPSRATDHGYSDYSCIAGNSHYTTLLNEFLEKHGKPTIHRIINEIAEPKIGLSVIPKVSEVFAASISGSDNGSDQDDQSVWDAIVENLFEENKGESENSNVEFRTARSTGNSSEGDTDSDPLTEVLDSARARSDDMSDTDSVQSSRNALPSTHQRSNSLYRMSVALSESSEMSLENTTADNATPSKKQKLRKSHKRSSSLNDNQSQRSEGSNTESTSHLHQSVLSGHQTIKLLLAQSLRLITLIPKLPGLIIRSENESDIDHNSPIQDLRFCGRFLVHLDSKIQTVCANTLQSIVKEQPDKRADVLLGMTSLMKHWHFQDAVSYQTLMQHTSFLLKIWIQSTVDDIVSGNHFEATFHHVSSSSSSNTSPQISNAASNIHQENSSNRIQSHSKKFSWIFEVEACLLAGCTFPGSKLRTAALEGLHLLRDVIHSEIELRTAADKRHIERPMTVADIIDLHHEMIVQRAVHHLFLDSALGNESDAFQQITEQFSKTQPSIAEIAQSHDNIESLWTNILGEMAHVCIQQSHLGTAKHLQQVLINRMKMLTNPAQMERNNNRKGMTCWTNTLVLSFASLDVASVKPTRFEPHQMFASGNRAKFGLRQALVFSYLPEATPNDTIVERAKKEQKYVEETIETLMSESNLLDLISSSISWCRGSIALALGYAHPTSLALIFTKLVSQFSDLFENPKSLRSNSGLRTYAERTHAIVHLSRVLVQITQGKGFARGMKLIRNDDGPENLRHILNSALKITAQLRQHLLLSDLNRVKDIETLYYIQILGLNYVNIVRNMAKQLVSFRQGKYALLHLVYVQDDRDLWPVTDRLVSLDALALLSGHTDFSREHITRLDHALERVVQRVKDPKQRERWQYYVAKTWDKTERGALEAVEQLLRLNPLFKNTTEVTPHFGWLEEAEHHGHSALAPLLGYHFELLLPIFISMLYHRQEHPAREIYFRALVDVLLPFKINFTSEKSLITQDFIDNLKNVMQQQQTNPSILSSSSSNPHAASDYEFSTVIGKHAINILFLCLFCLDSDNINVASQSHSLLCGLTAVNFAIDSETHPKPPSEECFKRMSILEEHSSSFLSRSKSIRHQHGNTISSKLSKFFPWMAQDLLYEAFLRLESISNIHRKTRALQLLSPWFRNIDINSDQIDLLTLLFQASQSIEEWTPGLSDVWIELAKARETNLKEICEFLKQKASKPGSERLLCQSIAVDLYCYNPKPIAEYFTINFSTDSYHKALHSSSPIIISGKSETSTSSPHRSGISRDPRIERIRKLRILQKGSVALLIDILCIEEHKHVIQSFVTRIITFALISFDEIDQTNEVRQILANILLLYLSASSNYSTQSAHWRILCSLIQNPTFNLSFVPYDSLRDINLFGQNQEAGKQDQSKILEQYMRLECVPASTFFRDYIKCIGFALNDQVGISSSVGMNALRLASLHNDPGILFKGLLLFNAVSTPKSKDALNNLISCVHRSVFMLERAGGASVSRLDEYNIVEEKFIVPSLENVGLQSLLLLADTAFKTLRDLILVILRDECSSSKKYVVTGFWTGVALLRTTNPHVAVRAIEIVSLFLDSDDGNNKTEEEPGRDAFNSILNSPQEFSSSINEYTSNWMPPFQGIIPLLVHTLWMSSTPIFSSKYKAFFTADDASEYAFQLIMKIISSQHEELLDSRPYKWMTILCSVLPIIVAKHHDRDAISRATALNSCQLMGKAIRLEMERNEGSLYNLVACESDSKARQLSTELYHVVSESSSLQSGNSRKWIKDICFVLAELYLPQFASECNNSLFSMITSSSTWSKTNHHSGDDSHLQTFHDVKVDQELKRHIKYRQQALLQISASFLESDTASFFVNKFMPIIKTAALRTSDSELLEASSEVIMTSISAGAKRGDVLEPTAKSMPLKLLNLKAPSSPFGHTAPTLRNIYQVAEENEQSNLSEDVPPPPPPPREDEHNDESMEEFSLLRHIVPDRLPPQTNSNRKKDLFLRVSSSDKVEKTVIQNEPGSKHISESKTNVTNTKFSYTNSNSNADNKSTRKTSNSKKKLKLPF
eukprot:gb/GECH01010147.1/.p1 GENE.gb/GECH01010147.1/~~gb/GECH01010147.1/.p1  ORF type:complete len:3306 (+),score=629.30 gb/GECH01010147.1/:1-9918(+)